MLRRWACLALLRKRRRKRLAAMLILTLREVRNFFTEYNPLYFQPPVNFKNKWKQGQN